MASGATGTADEQFEKLRQRFHVRLRKERRQLGVLTEALGGASGACASIYSDIRAFAHRLRGAALVFGFQGVGDGAKAVELAAIAAARDTNSRRRDPSVVSAMQELGINLTVAIRSGAPPITHSSGPSGQSSSW
jgi:hypothetical protein